MSDERIDPLEALEAWYLCQCDGDWEHSFGVKIDTIDNPGWVVQVDLEGTPLESEAFTPVQVDRSDHDWLRCRVEDGVFKGYAGPRNLREVLNTFFAWRDVIGAREGPRSE